MNMAHRWTLDDIFIGNVKGKGLDLYESYIGDVRSCYISACGDFGIPAVRLDGPTADTACHAVKFYGGEIVGSRGVGIYLKYGFGNSFFGTTVEGNTGAGMVIDGTISTYLSGMYFETNLNHIEIISATGPTIVGNYFATRKDGSLGDIGITVVVGAVISSNTFSAALLGGQYNLFGIGLDASLLFRGSGVKGNQCAVMPIAIEPRLITFGSATGTTIDTDNNVKRIIYGFNDYMDGIMVGGKNIIGGTGDPEGVVSGQRGSLYLRFDGTAGNTLYGKLSSGATGWQPIQFLSAGTTAQRPSTTGLPNGFQYFDYTLHKPIWWDASVPEWNVKMSKFVTVPSSASATGNVGDWSADATYLYICHAANTWKRVAIATW